MKRWGEGAKNAQDISRRLPPDDEKFALARRLPRWGAKRRVRRTERVYFITTRFYRGDPAGSSFFALRTSARLSHVA